jgi:hypothetical protein
MVMASEKYHPCLIGVGVGIGIGVEKAADQLPIPMPTATPRDIVVLTFYDAVKSSGIEDLL